MKTIPRYIRAAIAGASSGASTGFGILLIRTERNPSAIALGLVCLVSGVAHVVDVCKAQRAEDIKANHATVVAS